MHTRSPHDYIGKIVKIRLPYYDVKSAKVAFKSRPGLIIGCDIVANKMTGSKGILFTATYVDAFHKMDEY
ncbi:hypothetical protein V005_02524, partial [Staphylococcus aureus M520-1]